MLWGLCGEGEECVEGRGREEGNEKLLSKFEGTELVPSYANTRTS